MIRVVYMLEQAKAILIMLFNRGLQNHFLLTVVLEQYEATMVGIPGYSKIRMPILHHLQARLFFHSLLILPIGNMSLLQQRRVFMKEILLQENRNGNKFEKVSIQPL